jgi:hypothetical protein
MSSAISSALSGLSSAQDWFISTATAVAHANLPDSPPSDDLTSAIINNKIAASAVKVDAAVLHTVMDTEQSLIDVFA